MARRPALVDLRNRRVHRRVAFMAMMRRLPGKGGRGSRIATSARILVSFYYAKQREIGGVRLMPLIFTDRDDFEARVS
jgi:hypothetical protein